MAKRAIQSTRDYRLFTRSEENRLLNVKKHKKLHDSMTKYGFLPCFPIVCGRNDKGCLIVKDGQHRLMIAESLSLPVHWIEETTDFDIAVVNCAAKVWVVRDYAEKFAANGNAQYVAGLAFADEHGLPIGTAFSLLAGFTKFDKIQSAFTDGSFKIKDRAWAELVAGVYGPIVTMAPALKNARFIEACMAVCRVTEFDSNRLLHSAGRCREKLLPYSTRDSYLDMLEEIYNFNRSKLVGLKVLATMAMRERNPVIKKKAAKTAAA